MELPIGQKGISKVLAEARLKIAVFIDFLTTSRSAPNTLNAQFDIGIVLEALKERGDVVSKTRTATDARR